MNILSIQSSVAYGHVGNSAAVFPLQRMGLEVWPVNTVHFSNHTGYGQWRGSVLAAEDVVAIIRGIEDRGVLPDCDAVLSGYMGDASLGEVVVEAVGRIKRLNPKAVYCCDPVMGDAGRGFFVRPGIPEFIKEVAVPAADVITPNQFELEFLTGMEVRDLGSEARLDGPYSRLSAPQLPSLRAAERMSTIHHTCKSQFKDTIVPSGPSPSPDDPRRVKDLQGGIEQCGSVPASPIR